jgi:preprotein translocase subunit SecE
MNAKLKASQLVNRFYNLKPQKMSDYSCILWPTAKECARITIDEIKKELSNWTGGENIEFDKQRFNYLDEVNQEIENQ